MKVKINGPVVVDIEGNGRCEALAAGAILDFPEKTAQALIKAGHASAEPVIERAVHPAQR